MVMHLLAFMLKVSFLYIYMNDCMYFSIHMELRHFSWQFSALRLYGFFQDWHFSRFLAFFKIKDFWHFSKSRFLAFSAKNLTFF